MDETSNPQDPLRAEIEHVKETADNLHAATEAKAEQFQDVVENAWSDAGSLTQRWQTEVETYVRQNPTKAVFMALGLGFVLSRMFRK
jgi:ElaB/YqjD/DUF883 family membrane-anchored ribosome-binding protein